ncbi:MULTISPECIES: nickel pincer cofactor biosynthesis protein LarB [Coprobacillaceae]|uniref:nickel pincer cofactor biosynthesis protein LarB n=1 Tax=Coprobacillaceae TaxID=2810280 RepID=UPI000E4721B1|nr:MULTISPECIES: nickel pincer cofactor biosynthesis protein LarB [Coprobacillaceae]RHM61709.1 nickel pincer cofactor biosynthesis protein LarB [Coprobacillus sp. AF33-1AC]RHS91727.1 nickel pincer cofactor biosynthesis protein LarB [Erysipelatoclostridium sp. AM42-17]
MKVIDILQQVKDNQLTIEEAKQLIENPIDYANIDYNREKRTGVPEVIYGAGKTAAQIAGIIQNMFDHQAMHILVTKVNQEKYEILKNQFPEFIYDQDAKTFIYQKQEFEKNKGRIAVVCAGTSDLPVAKEAVNVARFLGNDVDFVCDVGVAGIHRLFNKMDVIKQAQVIVVVAGMEGALASVIGGLTDKPIIAVPTSVGYGANFQGLSALLAMLNSCASGMSVVNIDNGFGAGYMAHTINCIGGKK